MKKKVLVAMSGGVDSSVAAAMLVEQGYEVIGATMQVWDYNKCEVVEGAGTCCSNQDVDDARAVADQFGFPFYVLNCEEKFKESVIDPFIKSYLNAETPLPCVNCNTYLKFDHLIKKMKELECDYLATGHYAKVVMNQKGKNTIVTSDDSLKDQTYFLFTVDPKIVDKILFPIGHLNKTEVRKIAEEKNIAIAKKKDSTGICFVGNQSYANFLEKNVAGEILNSKKGFFKKYPTGEVIAPHNGIHLYTYGQSKGLGLDFHEKLFVIKIDNHDNTVWLGEEKYLFKSQVQVKDLHFLDEVQSEEELSVKIRYSQKGSLAKVQFQDFQNAIVSFYEPQRAVTPGQAAVFYRGKQLVGGGWII